MRIISPAPRDAWRQVLENNADATVFQTPEWTDCMTAVGGYEDASRLYETSDGRLILMPMGRWRPAWSPSVFEASMPHGWEYGGLLSNGPITAHDLMEVVADLKRRPFASTLVLPSPLTSDVWSAARGSSGLKATWLTEHILDLEGGFDSVWSARWSSATRTKVRKAEKSGISVECDTTGRLIPTYCAVEDIWLEQRAKERHLPVSLVKWAGRRRDPRKKMQALAQALGGSFLTWVAWFEGRPIAAAIQLLYGRHAHYWRSASVKRFTRSTRANDLLQRFMVERACQAGCRYYHMGQSGGVASLEHFKERFGGVPYRFAEYYVERVPVLRTAYGLQRLLLAEADNVARLRGMWQCKAAVP